MKMHIQLIELCKLFCAKTDLTNYLLNDYIPCCKLCSEKCFHLRQTVPTFGGDLEAVIELKILMFPILRAFHSEFSQFCCCSLVSVQTKMRISKKLRLFDG